MKDRLQPTRRQLLRDAGLALAASPLLGRKALAQRAGSPARLVCWPMMNGADAGAFYPAGNATQLSLITEPLRKWAGQITFLKGVNISGSTNHYAVRSTYSGFPIATYESADPSVKSVDQLVADQIAATAPTPLKSLHLGAIPADSINYYQRVGRSTLFFAPKPVDYEANPVTAFDRLFGGVLPTNGPTPTSADYTRSALEILEAEMADLTAAVGPGAVSELGKLNQHKEAWQELRGKPATAVAGTAGTLASVEKLRSSLQGNPKDAYKHALFSDIFDAQIDILARALVSGMTRVGTLQAGSADNNVVVPVDAGYPHHITSHGDQNIYNRLQTWYFGKLARLAQALDVPDPLDPGGRTVLQNTVVVVIAECLPVGHGSVGVPALLLGSGGGKFRPGLVNGSGITNKNIMATVLDAFGVGTAHFGPTIVSEART